jgi:hypothetical protein
MSEDDKVEPTTDMPLSPDAFLRQKAAPRVEREHLMARLNAINALATDDDEETKQ